MEPSEAVVSCREDDRTCTTTGSNEENEREPLHVLEGDHASIAMSSSKQIDKLNDDISNTVRLGTMGFPLFAVIGVSVCMALVSLVLLLRYVPNPRGEQLDNGVIPQDACARASLARTRTPIWVELIELQINVIQNLVHASLLGSAGMVAAFHGDVVWLYFARNCAFYFGLAALSYLVVDIVAIFNQTALQGTNVRLVYTGMFSFFTVLAVCKLDASCRRIRHMCIQFFRLKSTPPSTECGESLSPLIDVIYHCAKAMELLAIFYTVVTTVEHLIGNNCINRTLEGIVEHEYQHAISADILPFEMSYSLGAHQSFLLSLFLLAATCPTCPASVGGAILASAWRLVLAVGSITQVSTSASWTNDKRRNLSLFFTSMEAIVMVPILISALLLSRNLTRMSNQQKCTCTDKPRPRGRTAQEKGMVCISDYSQVEHDDFNELDTEADVAALPVEEDVEGPESTKEPLAAFRHQCTTLHQIASSTCFSRRKRNGAAILWTFNVILLVGMTLECMLVLKERFWDWNMMHEVYKWGMHVAAMYLFCSIMCVASPDVYKKARVLLALMCPIGSLVAIWQLYVLATNDDSWLVNSESMTISVLFAARALCGIGQCVGLVTLVDTVPESPPTQHETSLSDGTVYPMSKARTALFYIFLPSMIAYGVGVAITGNCSEPMISPTTGSCKKMPSMFMMAKNWPGMGLFFHFGLLLIIFASDGISSSPSYKPGLAVASLFSCHLTLLLIAASLWGIIEHVDELETSDWIRVSLTVPLLASSFYLFLCLHRVWKARILTL